MSRTENTTSAVSQSAQIPAPKRRGERLIGLLVGGIALLNFPLLSIFSRNAFVFDIPVLYFYLLSVWVLLIGVTAFVLRDKPSLPPAVTDKKDFTET
jgi:hypothetical protein